MPGGGVMTQPEVLTDYEALSQRASELFLDTAQQSVSTHHFFMVGLSGGMTPLRLYDIIAEQTATDDDFWQAAHIFQCDERHVGPDHPDSNFRRLRNHLFTHVPVPHTHIHRFMGEWANADRAAALYDDQVRVAFRTCRVQAVPVPQFDLLVLGMGTDGHTASLFPGSDVFSQHGRAAVATRVAKLASWRFTITPAVILAARKVIVLVSGAAKAITLEEVFNSPFEPTRYPVQICLKRAGETHWLADQAAASRLNR